MKRRCMAALLCLVMLLGLFPTAAQAAELVASGDCGAEGNESGVWWQLYDDGTLTIGGTGDMANYENAVYVPWQPYGESILSVIVEEDVTSIGASSLNNATCPNVDNISISNSVTSIGGGAFQGCTGLREFIIPANLTTIGVSALADCPNLTSVIIPSDVTSQLTSIGERGFWNCPNLTSIAIPVNVTSIEPAAFFGCGALTDVYYGGTQAQWASLASSGIDQYSNENLLDATIHCTDGVLNESDTSGYTVTFNPSGGTGSMSSVSLTPAEDGTASYTLPQPNGITAPDNAQFRYWVCQSRTQYDTTTALRAWLPGETAILTGDTEIGISWILYQDTNVNQVVWLDDDNSTILDQQTYPVDGTEPTTSVTPTREADSQYTYTFIGWVETTPSGGGGGGSIFYGNGQTVSGDDAGGVKVEQRTNIVSTKYYRPQFEAVPIGGSTYTVTFNPNGGTGSAYTQTVTAGQAATLTPNTFTRTGYSFTGWNTAADGSGTAYADGASVTLTENMMLYAQWAAAVPAGVLTITTQTIPEAVQYIPCTVPLEYTASVGTSPDVMWQVSSGSLPDGVALSESGVLSGAAKTAGVYPFTVTAAAFDSGVQPASRSYILTVKPVTEADWETVISDGYEILDRITDMYKYEDQSFRVAGPLSEFQSFYLDGNPLTAGTDYTTEEGSTRLNIPAATFQTAGEGTHTVAAAFTDSSGVFRVSGQNYIVDLSGNMQILTFGVNEYDTAVQYVPFSAVINAVPLYGDLRFEIVDRGNLPNDWEQAPGSWSLNPESGEITGVPQTAGTVYEFVVGVKHGDNGEVFDRTNVKITVMDNTRTNVAQETDPGFQVITPIPDMYEVTANQIFVSQGDFAFFTDFYLDGRKLIRNTEYTAESGSTRITVYAQVLRALGVGEHTAAATFKVNRKDGTTQTKVSSQNFSTGVQPVRPSGGGGGGGRSSGYAITLKQTTGGSVKSSTLSARSGVKVTLTLTPSAGYQVQSVRVAGTTGSDSVAVTRNGNQFTFTMPSKSVTVTPAFTRSALRVASVSVEHGKVSVSKSSAVPGAGVVITAHPDNGYVAAAFSAWDKDGKYLTVKDNGDGTASFTMPDSPVQVGARFELDPGLPVTDISRDNWFYEDARWAYRRGILLGVTQNQWVPEDRMSTATAVVTLARLAGEDLAEYQDVNWSIREDGGSYGWIPGEWYAPEARWAAVHHILTEDIFTGREALPRAYLALMLRRFLVQQGVVVDAPDEQAVFSDADAVRTFGPETEEAFQILYQADVFRGDSTKAMLPGAYTKRSHLAATLHRLSDFIIGYWETRPTSEQGEET